MADVFTNYETFFIIHNISIIYFYDNLNEISNLNKYLDLF